MNYNDICLVDFETTSTNKNACMPIQLAAVMIHGRKLEIKSGSEFCSLIRPPSFDPEECRVLGLDPLTEDSIAIHGKTRAMLEDPKVPTLKQVWANFNDYVNQHNFRGTAWTAPIMAGYNSRGYDSFIVDRICKEYGPTDKFGGQGLFHPIHHIDVMDIMWLFFEQNKDVKSLSVDNLVRKYFKYNKGTAHDALSDVVCCAEVLIRAMRLIRGTVSTVKWEGCMANA